MANEVLKGRLNGEESKPDSQIAKDRRAKSASKHFDYSRKQIDKIKAKIILDHQKLEDDECLEMRKKKREEDSSTTISTAKPLIRAV